MVTGGAAVSTPNMVNGPAPAAAQEGCAPPIVLSSSETESIISPRRALEFRRSNKPIMEKRRRARINNCLNELKTLILDSMKKDPARHSKLEKADILEMTVRHLESIQRQNSVLATATDPNVMNKFRAGFNECTTEVSMFPGLEPSVRRRLLQHLSTYLNGPEAAAAAASATDGAEPSMQGCSPTDQNASTDEAVQIHIVPSGVEIGAGGNLLTTCPSGTRQLMPTALSNRKLVTKELILPLLQSPPSSPSSSRSSPPPSPSSPLSASQRTSSAPSSSSIVSRSTSPVAIDRLRVQSPPGQLRLLLPALQVEDQPQNLRQRDAFSPVSLSSPYSPPSIPLSPSSPPSIPAFEPYSPPSIPLSPYSPPSIPAFEPYSPPSISLSPLSTGNSKASSCDALRPYSPDDMQKPLALVTRRDFDIEAIDGERPWRPWETA